MDVRMDGWMDGGAGRRGLTDDGRSSVEERHAAWDGRNGKDRFDWKDDCPRGCLAQRRWRMRMGRGLITRGRAALSAAPKKQQPRPWQRGRALARVRVRAQGNAVGVAGEDDEASAGWLGRTGFARWRIEGSGSSAGAKGGARRGPKAAAEAEATKGGQGARLREICGQAGREAERQAGCAVLWCSLEIISRKRGGEGEDPLPMGAIA
ncbi:hypothetical protein AXG93_4542s1510 [Marchantia polymorpha subsp. ruderalis]|uniref:Uncharacterized protein n=1 Tax=Marchantia polymorpha subsp. ruderalis TaxID=1480154 RepID=A0A176W0N1_MARPO|nr:hypothetical protein AXG93_4542s1510 [Marchantia polymorpha subsp. ruderalis]